MHTTIELSRAGARALVLAATWLLAAGALAAQIPMGRAQQGVEGYEYFNNPVFSSSTGLAYVCDARNQRILWLDPYRMSGENVGHLASTGTRPAALAVTPNGRYACSMNLNSNTVTIFDLQTRSTVTYTPNNAQFSQYGNIAFTADSQYGFICNAKQAANKVLVFRVADGTERCALSTGVGPARTYLNPEGTKAYVVCTGQANNDQITVVNISNFSVATTFAMTDADFDKEGPNGVCVNNLVFTPNGSKGVICDPSYNDILTFSTSNYSTQSYIHIGAESHTVGSLSQVAVSTDGRWAVASGTATRNIYVGDLNKTSPPVPTETFTMHDDYVGYNGFNNIVLAADGATGYIASAESAELVSFDYLTGEILNITYTTTTATTTTPTSSHKSGAIALSPDGTTVTVVNTGVVTKTGTVSDYVSLICVAPRVMNIPLLHASAGEYTGYAVCNPGNRVMSLLSYALNQSGTAFSGATTPAESILEAGAQTARTSNDLFALANTDNIGWAQMFSNAPASRGFFMEADPAGTFMDGGVSSTETFRSFHVTRLDESYDQSRSGDNKYSKKTEISVVNPFSGSVTLDLYLKNPDGTTRASKTGLIMAGGCSFTLSLRQIFFPDDATLEVNSGYLYGTVTSSSGSVTGIALTRYYDDTRAYCQTIRTLPFTKAASVSTLRCPHVATGGTAEEFPVPLDSTFSVINTSTEAARLTFQFYRDGESAPYTATADVPANGGQYLGAAWNLFGFPDPATLPAYVTGHLVVTSDKTGLVGDVVFGDGLHAAPWFQTSILMESETYRSCTFSHLAVGPVEGTTTNYISGFTIVNPSQTRTIAVTMSLYNTAGGLVGSHVFSIVAGGRAVDVLNTLGIIPGGSQIGGYFTLNSEDPFTACSLFQDAGFNMASAVPRN